MNNILLSLWHRTGLFSLTQKRSPKIWLFSLAFWLMCLAPAAALELRVALKRNVSQIRVGSSTNAAVLNGQGQQVGELAAMNAFNAVDKGSTVGIDRWTGQAFWVVPKDDGYVWIGDRWYRGKVHLVNDQGNLIVVNHVDLEEYLYSVVGAEAIPSWPLEALKAQAVAARTYALHKRASGGRYYDLDPTISSQVYKGLDSEFTTTHAAVKATLGQVMTYNGKVILAAFHSSSGGHTENVEDIWMQSLPYLRGVVDYDQSAPVFQWNKTVTPGQLQRIVGGVGSIRQLIPQKKTPQGRIITMKVVGDRGSKIVSGSTLRSSLDLRSTLFTAAPKNGAIEIQGRGFGHGVGLSQWGAYGLASQGAEYRQILAHYYQNSTLSKFY